MIFIKKLIVKRILFILIGGLLGYIYYYYIGCKNGCAIQSSPYLSTVYGAALGGVLSLSSKKKNINSDK